MFGMIEGVSQVIRVPHNPLPVDYEKEQGYVKTSVKVKDETQEVSTYIYDKFGRLVTTTIKSHDIGTV
jgi:hypothetical protein